jgi:CRISPR type III-A-associated protein Csm2
MDRFGIGGREKFDINKRNEEIDDKKLVKIRDLLESDKLQFLKEIEEFTRNINITQNQLRNLYDIIVDLNIENTDEIDKKLLKLRILLEYAHKRSSIKDKIFYLCMKEVIEDTLKNKNNKNKVNNFLQMFESIIAYSKEERR